MSVLIHDCTDCGHRQDMHGQGFPDNERRAFGTCPCCTRSSDTKLDLNLDPEPTMHETFTHPGGQPEPLAQPGSTRNSGTAHRSDVCGCERCQEIYAAS